MSDIPDHLPDNLPPSFTRLYFSSSSENEHLATSPVHDPVSEIKNLFEDVEEEVNHLRDNQRSDRLDVGVDELMIPRDLRQDVLSLYSLSSALIEAFAANLVKRELVVEEHRELDRVDKVFQRATGVKENLRLLYDMDVIDNGLHGELHNVVEKRKVRPRSGLHAFHRGLRRVSIRSSAMQAGDEAAGGGVGRRRL